MNKLLTIVVPIYNVELYINKCLDSCLIYKTNEQGEKVLDEDLMNQLEVIIVNDGTPDNSAEMSREYVKHYPQTFCQIDKENGGHGSAWNVGLKEATGKYLRFLDSDDWLTNLDKLMENLVTCEADLVFTDECVHTFVGNSEYNTKELKCSYLYNQEQLLADIDLLSIIPDQSSISFRKCTYKTIILQQQIPLFREKVSYDDTILCASPLLFARKVIAFDFVVYNLFRGRDDQSMNPIILRRKADEQVQAYVDLHVFIMHKKFLPTMDDLLIQIENGIFYFAFKIVVNLPYKRRKKLIEILLNNTPKSLNPNKQLMRYMKWPFWLAYVWDECRSIKTALCGILKIYTPKVILI